MVHAKRVFEYAKIFNGVKEGTQMFMKKWWLQFETQNGRRYAGWINTTAENMESFPEKITGTFYILKDETGCHGEFCLSSGETGYVVTAWMKPKAYQPLNHSSSECEKFFASETSLPTWERFDMKIEDCLCLEKTYIDQY